MFNLAFRSLIFIFLGMGQEIFAYRVALVEYFYDELVFSQLSPLDLANRNAKIYDDIVGRIKHEHTELDLVVFPEATLVAEPLNTPNGRLGMTFVPEPEDKIIPCTSSEKKYSSFFKLLSCTAQKYRTYLIINLKEKDDSSGSMKFYNTNVVFNRDGEVIARYRKYNIYLEPDTNQPQEPELVTFKTDFGEIFGIFTCFDIIFESPAIKLVRKGIKNFIFPTLWIPELPFLTTNQVQQMWAHGNDVYLMAAGAAFPKYGAGGLGIYLGGNITLSKIVTPRKDNFYLYENIPNKTSNIRQECSVQVNDEIAKEMDNYNLYLEDLSEYFYKKLDLEKSKTINETLCQNDFCCNFVIETKNVLGKESFDRYEYFLVIRNGLRTYGNKTYVSALETCGLIACKGLSISQCGQRLPNYDQISWPVTFKKISISAKFKNTERKMQFPNSLLADFSPISPACTIWSSELDEKKSTVTKTFSTKTSIKKLLTFGIFGRNYALD